MDRASALLMGSLGWAALPATGRMRDCTASQTPAAAMPPAISQAPRAAANTAPASRAALNRVAEMRQ